MQLVFGNPVNINQHFNIPADLTTWENFSYLRANGGMTPERPRATFNTLTAAMSPISDYGTSLRATFGVYIIGFDHPQPAFYVGVAGNDGKSPEGVAKRISKHRVKATGSHIGASNNVTGGVHHPKQWQNFSISRAHYYAAQLAADQCTDIRLAVGQLIEITELDNRFLSNESFRQKSGLMKIQPTDILEYYEHLIYGNVNGIRDYIYNLLWPASTNAVTFLTAGTKHGTCPTNPEIVLWDGSVYSF